MDRLYPYFQKDRPRSLKVRESMLLMCGQTRLLRSFAGAAETYQKEEEARAAQPAAATDTDAGRTEDAQLVGKYVVCPKCGERIWL